MRRFPLLLVPLSLSLSSLPGHAAGKLDFNRDIRPILSDNCFSCHGIDAKHRKADLRLDVAEGALVKNKDGSQAIVPGKADASTIIQRILSTDEDEVMPPPESHKKLKPAQIETLKRWINEGATYQKHWAFEAPVKLPVPISQFAVQTTSKTSQPETGNPEPKTAIDAFLAAELSKHDLTFSPAAKPHELIRRVTLDLTGLPPTSQEVDDFVLSTSHLSTSHALEQLIDRLLRSPRYGEHMARYWLDAARYGDTHGLHLDNERSIWPYRDWVVKAFNDNLPFDQFTVWQLAGDLLPNPTQEQLIATGFNRCNVSTSEGGSINEEWLYRYAVDRTDTTVGVFMGLTAGCAVCHDHKYDPISQKEFYQLYSFFYSTADPAMDGNILLTPPILQLATAEQKKQLADFDQAILAEQAKIREGLAKLEYIDPATVKPAPPVQTSETVWFDDSFPPNVKVEVAGAPTKIIAKDQGPVLSGDKALQRTAEGVAQDFFATGASFEIPPNGKFAVQCFLDPANKPKSIMLQFHVGGWNHRAVWGDEGAIPFGQVRTTERAYMGGLPEAGAWQKLEFPIEKVGLKPGMKVTGFAFTQYGGTVTWDRLSLSSRINPALDPQWSWSKWVERNQGKRVADLPQELQTLVRGKKAAEWTADESKRVQEWWFENEYQGARSIVEGPRAQKLAIEAKKKTLADTIPATFVMAELPERRQAHVMIRGQYDKPGDKVDRAVPAIFPPLPKQPDYTRLDLAKWLVSTQHPLTARVFVNRIWQQLFGVGLVKTSNDFGSQGEPPSHPELIDWLAVDFQQHGWDVKRLIKTIVSTKAYQQSARHNATEADASNRLLSFYPRRRLDAEVLRDQALFLSGLLNPKMGGKGAKPYQPDNIWEPVAYSGSNTRYYVQDKGENLYRRSLYTFYKRTAPPPSMTTFDAPSREQACTRREISNTPMQALNLMNDIQHVEAARNFAQRILRQGGTTFDARLNFAFRQVVARYPTAQEAAIIEQTLAKHSARYQSSADAAKQLTTFGDSKPDAKLNAAEVASWTMIANLLLNLDEALTK
jgi:hypothetical protein